MPVEGGHCFKLIPSPDKVISLLPCGSNKSQEDSWWCAVHVEYHVHNVFSFLSFSKCLGVCVMVSPFYVETPFQPIPEMAVEFARKSVFYQSHELEVFVLTPCYWQLKHRPLAPSALPAPLDSFLSDYESYFGRGAMHRFRIVI